MPLRRYEIFLPTRYMDGNPVEADKFQSTSEDLSAKFGNSSGEPAVVRRIWNHDGQKFDQDNVRLFVDVEDTADNAAFFVRYKETLKERFRRDDIWLVSFGIPITYRSVG